MTEKPDGCRFRVIEASIAELRQALESGIVTSVELVATYLNRVAYYDRHGIRLNAIPVLNPHVFAEARAADERRTRGETLGPLDGIPYTAKDSYKVTGLTVAAGSPAFENLVAGDDAFTIARLREAGTILIGLTNMPPMAGGGMQRGVYGRAESPYNRDYLTAAYGSGSSNGSGTATAASFASFGLGEETWSSGRAPASNNGLVAYTPSRGVISMRGNWPLVPTMDVVVPHTRTVGDMLEVLNAIVADDADSRGDFWRLQNSVDVPASSAVRPADYSTLNDPLALAGKRLGVPRMYINKDPDAAEPINTRASIMDLWTAMSGDLTALGAEVVEVDFPVVSNYERDRPSARSMVDRGLVSEEFVDEELWDLVISTWDDFLRANGDPALNRLVDVDGPKIFPLPPGSCPDRYEDNFDMADYIDVARRGIVPIDELPLLDEALRGLEETRRIDFEDWLDENNLEAVIFPAAADVAPHDADYNPISNNIAWRNGVRVSNGNLAIRHLGIPTVTVPMGVMSDIGMPVGLTIAGKAYSDSALLSYASAIEACGARREAPQSTPALPTEEFAFNLSDATAPRERSADGPQLALSATVSEQAPDGTVLVSIDGSAVASNGIDLVMVFVNGQAVTVKRQHDTFTANVRLPSTIHSALHSHWRAPYGSIVTALVRDTSGSYSGEYVVVGGIA